MRFPFEFFLPSEMGAELIYSFIIVVCSLMVYYATKEMYELTSYKGIKYFRQAFLFFAIAYFLRYSIKFFLIFFSLREVMEFSPQHMGGIPPFIFGWLSLFVFLYFSSMALFYLLYSIMWKKWSRSKSRIYLFNIASLIIALIGTSFGGREVYLTLNVILLLFASFVLFVAYKDSKKKQKEKNLFIIYLLLFVFWILNVVDTLIPKFLQFYQLLIYLASILLFMIILYKVLKKAGN
jgi:hypothetical protein